MIYIPFDSRKRVNARYAFITFVDAESALKTLSSLEGLPWSTIDGCAAPDKIISSKPAHVQGIRASLLQRTGASGGDPDSKQVLLLHEGRRVDYQMALRLYCGPPRRNPLGVDCAKTIMEPPGLAPATKVPRAPKEMLAQRLPAPEATKNVDLRRLHLASETKGIETSKLTAALAQYGLPAGDHHLGALAAFREVICLN